jgi:deoxyadenosine/deoxycytidine kinase
MANPNCIITLEGNIGAGKTTVAQGLFELFKNLGLKTVHIQEPVGAWVDFNGTNLLSLLYKDTERWAFTFQVNALMYMTEGDKRAVEYAKKGYIVIKERSAFTVKHIFNEHYKQYMTPAEIEILTNLSNEYVDPRKTAVAEGVIKDITLYLYTDPKTCYQRKLKRNRPEEIGKKNRVDEVYLAKLHEIHEVAIRKSMGQVIIADGSEFDPKNPEALRILKSGDFVFDALMNIGGLDDLEVKDNLEDEWTPEGDRITREKSGL